MGKKRTPEEKARRARENGFKDNMDGINSDVVHRNIEPCTEDMYGKEMDMWDEYEKCHPGADPHDMRISKHFVELIGRGTEGMLDEYATVASIRAKWRRFTNGWVRRTSNPIPEQIRLSITNYIKGELRKKIGLSTAQRPKHYLTVKKYLILLKQQWQNDWHEYRHEGCRVRFTAAMHFCTYSSARIGELFESSARSGSGKGFRYRDLVVAIRRDNDGNAEIVMTFRRDFAKGMQGEPHKRPIHPFHEKTDTLIVNPVLFILAIALADNAFRDYSTAEEIFAIGPPSPDEDMWELEWKDAILDVPFFQTMTAEGPNGSIQKASSFSGQLTAGAQRSGYENITVHYARREALIKADYNGYSEAERMKFAGQRNSAIFLESYMSQISTVDGQNSFLGKEVRRDYIEDLRGMSLRRHPQLWQSLPAKMQYELEQSPEFIAIEEEMESLAKVIKAAGPRKSHTEQARRRELCEKRRQITLAELKRHQKLQPRQPNSGGTCLEDTHRTFFARVRRLMPERDRLAITLFAPASLRSATGQAVLRDLTALCAQSSRVAYHPSMQPKMGQCPISTCALKMNSLPVIKRWKHIYHCHEAYLNARYSFVQFCYQCDEWLTDEAAWHLHCQKHLDIPESLPLQCDPLVFRHASACAGYCPFCLGDSRLPATRRMYQFLNRNRWQEHIGQHIQEFLDSNMLPKCQHPQCSIDFDSVQDLQHHLQDVHCVVFPKSMKRSRSDLKTEEEAAPKKRFCSKSDRKLMMLPLRPTVGEQICTVKNLTYKWTPGTSIADIDESTTSPSPGRSSTESDLDSENPGIECDTPGSSVCSDSFQPMATGNGLNDIMTRSKISASSLCSADFQEITRSDAATAKNTWMNGSSASNPIFLTYATDQDRPKGTMKAKQVKQPTGRPRGRPKGTTKVKPPTGRPRGRPKGTPKEKPMAPQSGTPSCKLSNRPRRKASQSRA